MAGEAGDVEPGAEGVNAGSWGSAENSAGDTTVASKRCCGEYLRFKVTRKSGLIGAETKWVIPGIGRNLGGRNEGDELGVLQSALP